jgi:hypothetical protein
MPSIFDNTAKHFDVLGLTFERVSMFDGSLAKCVLPVLEQFFHFLVEISVLNGW